MGGVFRYFFDIQRSDGAEIDRVGFILDDAWAAYDMGQSIRKAEEAKDQDQAIITVRDDWDRTVYVIVARCRQGKKNE